MYGPKVSSRCAYLPLDVVPAKGEMMENPNAMEKKKDNDNAATATPNTNATMAAAITKGLEITEYSPKKIKQSVTGNGNSTKEQVAAMLKTLCVMDAMPKSLDATDALAVAVCHHYQTSNPLLGNSKTTDWKSFITNNKDRVK